MDAKGSLGYTQRLIGLSTPDPPVLQDMAKTPEWQNERDQLPILCRSQRSPPMISTTHRSVAFRIHEDSQEAHFPHFT